MIQIKENIFTQITKQQAKGYSPLVLAFLGDGVYELLVRQKLISKAESVGMPVRKLHSQTVEKVRASYQAKGVRSIESLLSEEEADILRRGRNANSYVPKSASVSDYRLATGLETLFGYLHLIGEHERIQELFEVICNGC
ncbi:MAG: ribonuclease III [Oscillospiraceae bacterium]|nr:ribonuclease III [Oscillospiraceae bacterium]